MRDENSGGRYDGELALITYDIALKTLKNRVVPGKGPVAAIAVGGSSTN